jgi:hypothetical protein
MGGLIEHLPNGCRVFLEISNPALKKQGRSAREMLAPFSSNGYSMFRVENRYDLDFYRYFRGPVVTKIEVEALEKEELIDLVLSREVVS